MSDWKSKVSLNAGETLKHIGSKSKGFMAETDIDSYEVTDASGAVVGSVTVEDHTAVRGFRRTISFEQRDANGRLVNSESWTV